MMADASLAITTEYVKTFLAMIGKGIAWPDSVKVLIDSQDLHQLDVLHVMTHGTVVASDKETADGATFLMIGTTTDDVQIRVEFWADPNQLSMRILDVSRI
jgi:hypothetical protein